MTGQPFRAAFLRQLSASGLANSFVHALPATAEISIGRDPRCQIMLDSLVYGGVSRYHAKIQPIAGRSISWQICDLSSSNGTYINGSRLQGCRVLEAGDRIVLGQDGPQFLFELEPSPEPVGGTEPATAYHSSLFASGAISSRSISGEDPPDGPHSDAATLSQLFPIVSTGRDLARKAFLIPGIITVSFVVMMFVAVGNSVFFNFLVAAYLSGAAYYFVYQLCGKHKPWWLLGGAAIFTVLLLVSPVLDGFIFVFRVLLPGEIPADPASVNFLTLMIRMFFGAGLMEELLKAIPVLATYWIGTQLRSPYRERIGIWEPLDGILIGTASAVGFTLLETLGQYVPAIMQDVTIQAGGDSGELLGLQLLIPRILGSVAGHMAYSGYLGYFIGLSILKPKQRWRTIGIGYFSAAALHALWNTMGVLNLAILALVGVLSYAFLAAAILKARALSPKRSQNFATRFYRGR